MTWNASTPLTTQNPAKTSISTRIAVLPNTPVVPSWSWERMKGEPTSDYEAFLHFLKQGPTRTFEATKRTFKGRISWRTKNNWKWVERAEAFDDHMASKDLAAIMGDREEANQRQAEIGRQMQELAQERLAAFKEAGGRVSAIEAARIAEIGAKLERLALGEPTEEASRTRKTLEGFLLAIEVSDSRKVTD